MRRASTLLTLTALTLAVLPARAGNDPAPGGARAVGLANASVTLADTWAISNNVGALGGLQRPSVAVYGENRFNVSAFRTGAVAYAMPLGAGGKAGVIGFDASRFGDDVYAETNGALGYAYHQGPFSLGVKADLLQRSIEGLASRRAVAVSVGGVVQLLPALWLGAAGYNLNQAKLATNPDERIATQLKAGLSYRPGQKVMVNVETQKQVDQRMALVSGVEYQPLKPLALRTGFNTLTESFAFGIGGRARGLMLDYALTTHPMLGVSHHVGLTFTFGAEEATPSATPNVP